MKGAGSFSFLFSEKKWRNNYDQFLCPKTRQQSVGSKKKHAKTITICEPEKTRLQSFVPRKRRKKLRYVQHVLKIKNILHIQKNNAQMCLYIYMIICVYIHKYIYVYCQYICICIRRYVYVYIYIYVCVYLRLRCMPCPDISTKSTNNMGYCPWPLEGENSMKGYGFSFLFPSSFLPLSLLFLSYSSLIPCLSSFFRFPQFFLSCSSLFSFPLVRSSLLLSSS